jgi:large subunit ribosomal protein L41
LEASPQLHFCRTFSVIATADRGNSEPRSRGANYYLSGNRLNLAGPILASIDPMSENCKFGLPLQDTRRFMSKYLSKSATKRLPLTTKRAGKGYYKGKGCTSEGRLTSKGKFIADPLKKLQLIVPDLRGFALKPYISRTVAKSPPKDQLSLGAGQ